MSGERGERPAEGLDVAALLARAREARAAAWAPYSGFPVGAALLTRAGAIFTGCNVENAAYPASLCAERVALGSAIAAGARGFVAIAIVGASDDAPCWPCGGCRQVLHEHAPELQVVTPQPAPAAPGGTGPAAAILPLRELLPHGFTLARPSSAGGNIEGAEGGDLEGGDLEGGDMEGGNVEGGNVEGAR